MVISLEFSCFLNLGAGRSWHIAVEFNGKEKREGLRMDKWDGRFIEVAGVVAGWSSCLRRQVGAVIVRSKRILTTGYNGAPAGLSSCAERGECLREILHVPSGTRQELCYAIHAEQNAVIQAARMGVCIEGATLYCTHQPCVICTKIIINAGIARIVYRHPYPDEFSRSLLCESGIAVERWEEKI
jgi:dCMP deaminase